MKKVKCLGNLAGTYWLTIGKVYEVMAERDNHYNVRNDQGNRCPYPSHLFEIVEDEKENKESDDSTFEKSVVSLLNQTIDSVSQLVAERKVREAREVMSIALMAQDLLAKL